MNTVFVKENEEDVVGQVVEALRLGGAIIHPTDTCYGLAADIRSEAAVKKIYGIKKMAATKPVSILVSSLEMAREYGLFSIIADKLAEKYWPGPLTMIVPRAAKLPRHLNPDVATIGIRWPLDPLSVKIIEELGAPIVTTSANVSGQSEVYVVDEFLAQLSSDDLFPDLVVNGGLQKKNKPSTIVEVDESGWKLLRKGDLDLVEEPNN